MSPDIVHDARKGDVPTGDTYQSFGGYAPSPGNVGLYRGALIAILVLAALAALAWVLFT